MALLGLLDWTAAVVLAQEGAVTGASQEEKSTQPLFSLGHLHLRASAGVTYDDNILLTAQNPQADTIWSVQPGLQVVVGDQFSLLAYRDRNYDVLTLSPDSLIVIPDELWPGKVMILDYSPRFQWFTVHRENDYIDQLEGLNALWPMAKLILGVHQDYKDERISIVEAGQRIARVTADAALNAAYGFSDKTSTESSISWQKLDYGKQTNFFGYTEWSGITWLNLQSTSDLNLSAGLAAGRDDVVNNQGQTFERVQTRARYRYAERLVFDASVGGEWRQYDGSHADTLDPVFSIGTDYRPQERTSFRLIGSRQQYASVFDGFNYSSTGATLAARQGVTDRVTIELTLGYALVDYQPVSSGSSTGHTEDSFLGGAVVEVKITRHLDGQAFYQYRRRTSESSADIINNQAGVQLSWHQ